MTDNVYICGKYVYLRDNWGVVYIYDSTAPLIGRGGMGEVYKGFNCVNGEAVAIKRIHDQIANNPSVREKARREAKLAFSHPNIVEMLGFCETRCGVGPIFIISRMFNGVNVDTYLSRIIKAPSNKECAQRIVRLFLPILDGLQYLHSNNMCHLDIKPSNVMVDNHSIIKLMDLGITNVYSTSLDDDYGELSVLGTPRYAAPEQFTIPGKQRMCPCFASDIYEFGVMLYEILSGTKPFAGNSLMEVAKLHFTTSLSKSNNIPSAIMTELLKATSFNISERHNSVQELKLALENALLKGNKKHWFFNF